VEWVLGSTPVQDTHPPVFDSSVVQTREIATHSVDPLPSFQQRNMCMWLLDFDKSQKIDVHEPEKCVEQLLRATTGNDPYYPNPNHSSHRLWEPFRKTYLVASEVILNRIQPVPSWKDLPELFIKRWIEWAKEDAQVRYHEDDMFEHDDIVGDEDDEGWGSDDCNASDSGSDADDWEHEEASDVESDSDEEED
jgi:hypothetical protein